MCRNAKIKIFICVFLHVFVGFVSLCCWYRGKVDGKRGDLLCVETTGHHLHHRMLHIADLVGMHHRREDFCVKAVDSRNTLVCSVLAVAGDTFT